MKKEIRDGLLLTGALASCIAAVLFLLDTASPANSGWQFDNAGLVAFVLGLAAIGFAVILDIVDYILDQRPWASAPDVPPAQEQDRQASPRVRRLLRQRPPAHRRERPGLRAPDVYHEGGGAGHRPGQSGVRLRL